MGRQQAFLSRGQGMLANGCRTPTHGCEAVVIWSCRVLRKPSVTATDFNYLFSINTQYIDIEKEIMPLKESLHDTGNILI